MKAYIERHLNDPILRRDMRFGLRDTPTEGPTEFNETPYAHKHRLFNELLDFNIHKQNVRACDFVFACRLAAL